MKALLKRMCSFLSGEDGPRATVNDGTTNDMLDSTRRGLSDYLRRLVMFLTEGRSENVCSE